MLKGLINGIILGAITYGIIDIFLPMYFIQAIFVGAVTFGIVGIILGSQSIKKLRNRRSKFFQFYEAALGVFSGGFAGVLIQIPTQTKNPIEPFNLFIFRAPSKFQLLRNSDGSTLLLYFCAFLGLILTIIIDMIVKNESV